MADASTIDQLAHQVQRLISSATQLVDGEEVVGYKIKTGALHTIVGLLVCAQKNVFFPLGLPTENATKPPEPAEAQAMRPLTEEQIETLWRKFGKLDFPPQLPDFNEYVQAIERAHGITEAP